MFRDEQESLTFIQPKTESPAGFELVSGIKSVTVEYKVRPFKEKKEKEKQADKLPPLETFSMWGKPQIEKIKKNLPRFVDITISFWGRAQKRARNFTFKMMIVADDIKPEEIRKTPAKTKNKTETTGSVRARGPRGVR